MAILQHLLTTFDDVVYRVHPSAMTVVIWSVKSPTERFGADQGPAPYPPPTLSAVA